MDNPTLSGEQINTYKLPPFYNSHLPVFSGDMKNWMEFRATCRTVLTDRLHEIERLQQLKDALIGEPRELIAHILPADGAYDRAMLLLKQRYENERAIVNSQLHRLYALTPNELDHENASTLRSILNTIHSVTWNSILIFNTSQCLHTDSRNAWEEKLEGTRAVPSLK